jgi:hypothetical protein
LVFIDKDAVKITFETIITFDQAISIISDLSQFTYEGEVSGFFVWSDKNKNASKPVAL